MNRIAARFSAVILLAVGLAVAFAVALNYFKFRQSLEGLAEDRLAFVAGELGASIQRGLDLGLDLDAIANVEPLLERTIRLDPGIRRIRVIDAEARTVFAVGDPGGEELPAPARLDEGWSLVTQDALVVASLLHNSFGLPVGAVAISYSKERPSALAGDMLVGLLQVSALAVGLMVLPALILVQFVYRRTRRRLDLAHRHLTSSKALPDPGAGDGAAGIVSLAAAAGRRLAEAEAYLSESEEGTQRRSHRPGDAT